MAGIILIAGANSALGLSLIEPFLSQYPTYNVLATVRNASPKEDPDTAKLIELVSKYPGANITIEALDLSDVSAVQSFASDLSHRISKKLLPQILLLICNDMVFNPKGKQLWPIDGHDDMFQVFNEGRFRLVLRLLDSMVPKKGRIGLLSSISHDTEPAYLAPPFNSNDDLPVRVPKESKRGQRYRDTPRPVDASWDALHRSLRYPQYAGLVISMMNTLGNEFMLSTEQMRLEKSVIAVMNSFRLVISRTCQVCSQ